MASSKTLSNWSGNRVTSVNYFYEPSTVEKLKAILSDNHHQQVGQ